ncbi:MAG: hypothetical protein MI861_10495, partial [Pirellulales bacterium]|nr:hypothetical protein [Pirellulales bacterium]
MLAIRIGKRRLAAAMIGSGMLLLASTLAKAQQTDLEQRRMELMRRRAGGIVFLAQTEGFPKSLQPEPLFRYDDLPRGYVDGAVWRLGDQGRPLAIVTTELHPKYLGGGPRIVYDFLSLSPVPFSATSEDANWTPSESAVVMQPLADAPRPAGSAAMRLIQMKRIIQRFKAVQVVTEGDPEEKKLNLRLLPRPIERYTPSKDDKADGTVFLFVAGRMPGVIAFLETKGSQW